MTRYRITLERIPDDAAPTVLIDMTGDAQSIEYTCTRIVAYVRYIEGIDNAAADNDSDNELDA